MSVREHDWMGQLLGVSTPWQITDVRIHPSSGVVSVQIEQPEGSSRFWPLRRAGQTTRNLRWDHNGLAGHRCEVVVIVREGQKLPEASWTGEADMPFTRGLSRLVLDLLLEGTTMSQLCRLLELPFSDLWKYKYRLDQGATPVPAPTAKPAAADEPVPVASPEALAALAAQPVAPAAASAAESAAAASPAPANAGEAPAPAGLPGVDSPVWLALLKGRLALEVQALGLKLLLTKTLREAQMHSDADLHRQAAQALHRYFERNQTLLAAEISQLATAHRQSEATGNKQSFELPDVSDPLWLELLNGKRDLDVRTLSLRLLLSRLRGQARLLQNDDVRMLKLVELHRFFEKNQAVLRHEISQIKTWAIH